MEFNKPPPPIMAAMMGGFQRPLRPMIPIRPDTKIPAIFSYSFDDPKEDKKWQDQRADITDYFNYGFNEESWRIYADKVVKLSSKIDKWPIEKPECAVLNDRLPVELGGFGDPYFEKIKELPYFKLLNQSKDMYVITKLIEYSQVSEQYQGIINRDREMDEALAPQALEEYMPIVKESYNSVVPDLLQMRHKLPNPPSIPKYSKAGPMLLKPHNSLLPGMSLGPPPRSTLPGGNNSNEMGSLPSRSNYSSQPTMMTSDYNHHFSRMITPELSLIPSVPDLPGLSEKRDRKKSTPKDNDSDHSSSQKKDKKKKKDKNRSRSNERREKKRKDNNSEDESEGSKHKKAEKERRRDRDDREKDRSDRERFRDEAKSSKHKKKEAKEKHKESRDNSRERSLPHSPKRKEPIHFVKDKKETTDIRKRIQVRK